MIPSEQLARLIYGNLLIISRWLAKYPPQDAEMKELFAVIQKSIVPLIEFIRERYINDNRRPS